MSEVRTAQEGPDVYESLRIATDCYYYKPFAAFFGAFELEAFSQSPVPLTQPVLDLGGNDGAFIGMLHARGVIDGVDTLLDYQLPALRAAKDRYGWRAIRGDALHLPLCAGAFNTVVCNDVISCLFDATPDTIAACLAEAYRVLSPGGVLAMTAATPAFVASLLVRRALTRLGLLRLSAWYVKAMRRRLGMTQDADEGEWRRRLRHAGFVVDHVGYFHSTRQAWWWNSMVPHPVRVFSALRFAPAPVPQRAGRGMARLFARVFREEIGLAPEAQRPTAGYLLLVAHRPE